MPEHRIPALPPVEPAGGLAALMLADAMWVEQVTAAELAEAARRPVEWVNGVVSGDIDPTADELELALNAIGLEMRIVLGNPDFDHPLLPFPGPPHDREKLAEFIRRSRDVDLELYGEVNIQRSPPQPGATARLFGVGQDRRDGGGWAAVLVSECLSWVEVPKREFASTAGITEAYLESLLSGSKRPLLSELERVLAANGMALACRLEAYDAHDDELQIMWEHDPAAYESQNQALRNELAGKAIG